MQDGVGTGEDSATLSIESPRGGTQVETDGEGGCSGENDGDEEGGSRVSGQLDERSTGGSLNLLREETEEDRELRAGFLSDDGEEEDTEKELRELRKLKSLLTSGELECIQARDKRALELERKRKQQEEDETAESVAQSLVANVGELIRKKLEEGRNLSESESERVMKKVRDRLGLNGPRLASTPMHVGELPSRIQETVTPLGVRALRTTRPPSFFSSGDTSNSSNIESMERSVIIGLGEDKLFRERKARIKQTGVRLTKWESMARSPRAVLNVVTTMVMLEGECREMIEANYTEQQMKRVLMVKFDPQLQTEWLQRVSELQDLAVRRGIVEGTPNYYMFPVLELCLPSQIAKYKMKGCESFLWDQLREAIVRQDGSGQLSRVQDLRSLWQSVRHIFPQWEVVTSDRIEKLMSVISGTAVQSVAMLSLTTCLGGPEEKLEALLKCVVDMSDVQRYSKLPQQQSLKRPFVSSDPTQRKFPSPHRGGFGTRGRASGGHHGYRGRGFGRGRGRGLQGVARGGGWHNGSPQREIGSWEKEARSGSLNVGGHRYDSVALRLRAVAFLDAKRGPVHELVSKLGLPTWVRPDVWTAGTRSWSHTSPFCLIHGVGGHTTESCHALAIERKRRGNWIGETAAVSDMSVSDRGDLMVEALKDSASVDTQADVLVNKQLQQYESDMDSNVLVMPSAGQVAAVLQQIDIRVDCPSVSSHGGKYDSTKNDHAESVLLPRGSVQGARCSTHDVVNENPQCGSVGRRISGEATIEVSVLGPERCSGNIVGVSQSSIFISAEATGFPSQCSVVCGVDGCVGPDVSCCLNVCHTAVEGDQEPMPREQVQMTVKSSSLDHIPFGHPLRGDEVVELPPFDPPAYEEVGQTKEFGSGDAEKEKQVLSKDIKSALLGARRGIQGCVMDVARCPVLVSRALVNEVQVDGVLVDSGASANLLRSDVVSRLMVPVDKKRLFSVKLLLGDDRHKVIQCYAVQVQGLSFIGSGFSEDVVFYGCDELSHPMILGTPFLRDKLVTFDVSSNRLLVTAQKGDECCSFTITGQDGLGTGRLTSTMYVNHAQLMKRMCLSNQGVSPQSDEFLTEVSREVEGGNLQLPTKVISTSDQDVNITIQSKKAFDRSVRRMAKSAKGRSELMGMRSASITLKEIFEEGEEVTMNSMSCEVGAPGGEAAEPSDEELWESISEDFPQQQREKLFELLKQHRVVFSEKLPDISKLRRSQEFTVDASLKEGVTLDDIGSQGKAFALNPVEMQFLRGYLAELVNKGIIEHASGPVRVASSCFLVKKPSGGFRLVVDYRKVNSCVQSQVDHIPTRAEMFSQLCRGKDTRMSVADLTTSFFQLETTPLVQELSTFTCAQGVFRFLVLPQGLKISPQAITRVMRRVLAGLECVYVYIDDLIIVSPTAEQHVRDVDTVLQRLKQHRLYLKFSKSRFGTRKVSYLGFEIDGLSVNISDEKVKAVVQAKPPTSKVELSAFIGLLSFLRGHICGFEGYMLAFRELRKKHVPFYWGKEQQQTFEAIKKVITSKPTLQLPDFSKPMVLATDASSMCLGAVLLQEANDGSKNEKGEPRLAVLGYWSKQLSKSEQHFSIFDKELLALFLAVEHFKFYTRGTGRQFKVLCDNSGLTMAIKSSKLQRRRANILISLSEHDFTIHHVKSEHNPSDWLSRLGWSERKNEQAAQIGVSPFLKEVATYKAVDFDKIAGLNSVTVTEVSESIQLAAATSSSLIDSEVWLLAQQPKGLQGPRIMSSDVQILRRAQQIDDDTKRKVELLRQWQRELLRNTEAVKPSGVAEFVLSSDGLLLRRGKKGLQLVIPETQRRKFLSLIHDERGHPGMMRCIQYAGERLYWGRMRGELKEYVRGCEICQLAKLDRERPAGQMSSEGSRVSRPLQSVTIDFMTGLVESGDGKWNAIMIIIDNFSKYAVAVPIRDTATSAQVIELVMQHWVYQFGPFERLKCDRDIRFKSELFKGFSEMFGFELRMAPKGTPEYQGVAERFNASVGDMLRILIDHDMRDWSAVLSQIIYTLNTSFCKPIGTTPYELLFGRPHFDAISRLLKADGLFGDVGARPETVDYLQQRAESFRRARDMLDKARKVMSERYNRVHSNKSFAVGDRVKVCAEVLRTADQRARPQDKFRHKWVGPFTVVHVSEDKQRVTLDLEGVSTGDEVFHIKHCRAYREDKFDREAANDGPEQMVEGHSEWEVAEVLQHRVRKCGKKGRAHYFLTRWKGFSDNRATWEHVRAFKDGDGVITTVQLLEFLRKNPMIERMLVEDGLLEKGMVSTSEKGTGRHRKRAGEHQMMSRNKKVDSGCSGKTL